MSSGYPFFTPTNSNSLPLSPPSFENFEFSNLFSFDSTDALCYNSLLDPLISPSALETNFDLFNLETSFIRTTPLESINSTSLLDSNETEMFSSFLSTMQVDEAFLFNPILPPGLPSPPAPFHSTRERNSIGSDLGQKVESISLDSGERGESRLDGRQRRKGKEIRRYAVEEQEEEEESIQIKEEELDEYELEDDFSTPGRGTTRKSPITSKLNSQSRAKKLKVQDEDFSIPSMEDEEDEEDEMEMDDLPTPVKSKPNKKSISPILSRSDSPDSIIESKKSTLSDNQKRSNHILSEQKRRNAIRSGFKDLVDLLIAGEISSKISISNPIEIEEDGKKKKGKGNGRGRGRKGEIGAGAAKSVILEKANSYMKWLQAGNDSLEQEVLRVEACLTGR